MSFGLLGGLDDRSEVDLGCGLRSWNQGFRSRGLIAIIGFHAPARSGTELAFAFCSDIVTSLLASHVTILDPRALALVRCCAPFIALGRTDRRILIVIRISHSAGVSLEATSVLEVLVGNFPSF